MLFRSGDNLRSEPGGSPPAPVHRRKGLAPRAAHGLRQAAVDGGVGSVEEGRVSAEQLGVASVQPLVVGGAQSKKQFFSGVAGLSDLSDLSDGSGSLPTLMRGPTGMPYLSYRISAP